MHPLLRPKWLIVHVIVLLIAVTFISLGLWQLRRLDERRGFNATLRARADQPVTTVESLLGTGDPDAVAYRRATTNGTYDLEEELVLLSRSRNGIAGNHIVTPLRLQDGTAILVDRGWVPFRFDRPPVADAAPPPGDVTVTGLLFPEQTRGRFGPQQEPGEELDQIFRVDIGRLRAQFPYELRPLWLLLEAQRPTQARELPLLAEGPRLDLGPHLAYAIQWFLFSAIGMTGYPILLRQRLHASRRAAAHSGAASGDAAARATVP